MKNLPIQNLNLRSFASCGNSHSGWKTLTFLALVFIGNLATAQVNVPINGTDTTNICAGIVRDPGGTGNYPNSSYGVQVIDPPGNAAVSLTFSQFSMMSGDYIYLYDGVGTNATYIGYYYGTYLPNNGNAIVASSGAITIEMSTNSYTSSTGFQATWVTGATTAPNASFAVSSTSPGYNSPVQFINTTTNGGEYLWEFGDGTTSTEENPIHSYTTAGQQQARLIATNCTGSDTTGYTTLNVQSPPVGTLSADTVTITVPCGSSNSGSFTIGNTGTGNLSYNLSLNQQSANLVLDEEFESSSLGSFVNNSTMTTGFPSAGAPQGSQYLSVTGYGSFYSPLYSEFESSQPTSIKYHVKSDSYTSYNGFVLISDKDAFNNHDYFFYSQFRYSDLRLYYGQNGYTNTYYYPYNTGDWVEIEVRNIDWNSQTYDVYVDGSAVITGADFIYPVTSVNNVMIYNNYSATVGIDDIEISALDLLNDVTFNPTSGNLSTNSNNVIFINADASDLMAGTYYLDFEIESNDTALDGTILPLEVIVTGNAQLNQSQTCINMGNVFNNNPKVDSVLVWNTGCDSLELNNVSSTSGDISVLNAPFNLGQNDSAYVKVQINASAAGTYTDTVSVSGPDTTFSLCISAQSTQAPDITSDSVSYNLTSVGCNDSIPFSFKLYNVGGGSLDWNIRTTETNFDDFENGQSSLWSNIGSNIIGNTCHSYSGTNALYTYGYNRYAQLNSFNIGANGSMSFYLQENSCGTVESNEDLILEYSTNGGSTWTTVDTYDDYTYHYIYGFQLVTVNFTSAMASPATIFRFSQTSYSSSGDASWVIDDLSITTSVTNGSFTPSSGNTASGDSVSVSGYLDVSGLFSGTYSQSVSVVSNDPGNGIYDIPITITVQGSPDLQFASNACVDFGTVIDGTSATDSVMIYNTGCDSLIFSGTTVTNSDFSANTPSWSLVPGDTSYVTITFSPNTLGAVNDTIYLNSNDTTNNFICVTGIGQAAPDLVVDTSAINVTINGCNDSVLVQRTIYNNGQGPLDFEIDGEPNVQTLQDVLDTFKVHYPNITALNPSTYNFSEGTVGYSINDGGGDMYDGGNRLNTNLSSFIYYSDDLVIPSTSFGTNGQYFTYKGTGIWLFAADLDGITSFSITGNLGADGSGSVSATTLTSTAGGVNYTGFVKRVYNAGDPSINHLIIVETDPAISRTHYTYTGSENHTLSNLNNTDRMYYMLFAGSSGAFISDAVIQSMMDEFVDMLSGSGLPPWVSVSPDSARVAAGDSSVIDIWVSTTGLGTGTHNSEITIGSNDPNNPGVTIPVQLTLNGMPEITAVNNTGCISFAGTQQGATTGNDFMIYNSGCDTLDVTGFNSATGEFAIGNLPLYLAPGDSAELSLEFSPVSVGSFNDTLEVLSNDTSLYICVDGTSVGAPVLGPLTDTLKVDLNKCNVIKNVNFRLDNTGQGAMNYDVSFGGYNASSQIAYSTTSATTTHTFSGVPSSDTLELRIILHGDYDDYYERSYLYIDNHSYYYGYLYDNGRNYMNDTIELTFYGNNVQNWTADGVISFDLENTYDVDGGAGSFHQIDMRLASQVNWVSVVGATSGNIAAGAYANKNLLFNAASLPVGTYLTNMNITTNTPGSPNTIIPVELNVISEAEMTLSDTCVNYPLTLIGDTAARDFWIYNTGCEPLSVSSVLATNNDFKITPANGNIPVGDSLMVEVSFVPTTVNSYSASLLINSNDTNAIVCLTATSNTMPTADFQYSLENSCRGEVIFSSSSQHTTNVLWNFGDGTTSNQTHVTHAYAEPGTYTVMLRADNSAGYDTITKTVTVNPLYVDFSMSPNDTVLQNTTVDFYDSSAVPTTWDWNFGDGNTASVQHTSNTFANLGKYEITLEVEDARGCVRSVKKDLYVVEKIGLVESRLEGGAYTLYPNPTGGLFNLESNEINWSDYELNLVDATGRFVRTLKSVKGSNSLQIDLGSLTPGMYQLIITKDGELKGRESVIKY